VILTSIYFLCDNLAMSESRQRSKFYYKSRILSIDSKALETVLKDNLRYINIKNCKQHSNEPKNSISF